MGTLRNSMSERTREFAILRCLGASRLFITKVVLGQSLIIAFLGALGSFMIYFLTSSLASYFIRKETGVMLEPVTLDLNFGYVFLSIIFLGLASGIPPAISAYRVDISKNLQHKT